MMDMLPLLLDEKAHHFDSRYRVVLVSVQRAKQLMRGTKRAHTSKFTKETSVALEEVLGGDVKYLMGEEAQQALREAKSSYERDVDALAATESDERAKDIRQRMGAYVDGAPKEGA